jgi:hypothetical protein
LVPMMHAVGEAGRTATGAAAAGVGAAVDSGRGAGPSGRLLGSADFPNRLMIPSSNDVEHVTRAEARVGRWAPAAGSLERAKGLEPSTPSLGSSYSTN